MRQNALRNILLRLQHMGLVKYGDTVEVTEAGRAALGGETFARRQALKNLRDAVARHGYSLDTADGRNLFSAMRAADALLEKGEAV